ncbi:MAG TPA: glycosyltransferase [Saprospiraceae bacterium]|nr:glycosyltransferase [Saprospiraceae bacterium]
MSNFPLVSIIITNYNYDRYVRMAIESALHQSWQNIEVIVVDDGSTDKSREIIRKYEQKARIILKENGGQGSAFNAGFAESKGEIILFLDADDVLLHETVEKAVRAFTDTTISKVHWYLWVIDEHGNTSNKITPEKIIPHGKLIKQVIELGPNAYNSPPTSGNAWSRDFLEKVLPMPESAYTISADNYLCMLAPLYGEIQSIPEPIALYRLHGNNNFRGKYLEETLLQSKVNRFNASSSILQDHLVKLGHKVNTENWDQNSWLKKLSRSILDIKKFVPEKSKLILADDDQWQLADEIAGRKVVHFIEKENQYWGPPANDDEAIKEIERQIRKRAGFIFFAWPSFWWFDYYKKMYSWLLDKHECVIRDERLVGFKLKELV